MFKYLFTLVIFVGLLPNIYSQTIIRCSIDEKAPAAYENYPAFLKSVEKSIQEFNANGAQKSSSTIITIPVHVILVHNPGQAIGTGTNFSVEHVQSQIDVMNEDFRRLNSDSSNTPSEFAAGDSEIEFCLASVDPNGNPTDGITRYSTTQNMNSNEFSIKSATGWNRNDYLNIWSAPNLGGLLGWAYLPSTTNLPNATLDGVVCAAGSFGGPGFATNNPYHLGRTVTHEIGHYLGLRHIWRNNGCSSDDGFADTPLQDDEYFGCPSHPQQSCGSNDMFMNYMDYVNDNCMNAFSVQQGDYMQTILNTSRSSLLNAASTLCNNVAALTIELVASTDVTCFGDATGSLEVAAGGGVPPYSYSINNGASQGSGVFNQLLSGSYDVEVTDDNGNTAGINVFISSNEELLVSVNSIQNNPCSGFSQGSVILQLDGGIPPYFVDGQAASGNQYLISNLATGNYTSIIMDSEFCEKTIQYEITEPLPVLITVDEVVEVSCFGEPNGGVDFTVFGGTPEYQVLLNGNPISNNTIINLPAGDYDIQAVDALGCIGVNSFEISQPNLLTGFIENIESITCSGVDLGSVTLAAEGGTEPYAYSINGSPFGANPTFELLDAGDYTAEILDANNCLSQTTFTINQGYIVSLSELSIENPSCGNSESGGISVEAQNGVAPYTYLLSQTGESNSTGIFNDLTSGTYQIITTDINGCITSGEWTLTEESSLNLEVETIEIITCSGASSGLIVVSSNNGAGTVSYSIDGSNYQQSGLFTNLSAGSYTVSATDDSGCITQILVNLEENPPIQIESESTVISCHDGTDATINLSATGGAGGFIFSGNGEENETGFFGGLAVGNYTFTITDEAGCALETEYEVLNIPQIQLIGIQIDSTNCFGASDGQIEITSVENAEGSIDIIIVDEDGQETEANMLSAGIYTILVEDENGCTASESVEVFDEEAIQWEIIEQSDANCDGSIRGDIQVQATTGVPPYSYAVGQIENSNGYFQNFNAGNYALSITDANACTNVVQFTIGQSDAFTYGISDINNVSCFDAMDGSVQFETEDIGAFIFTFNGTSNAIGLFENLGPGIYPFEIEDSTSCIIYDTLEITSPEQLSIVDIQESINIDNLTDLIVEVQGGTSPYQYRLDNGAWQDEGVFIGLPNGSYEIEVIDANGCTSTINQTILDLDIESTTAWRLYPNPFSETLYLEWESFSQNDVEIYLVNVVGQRVGGKLETTIQAGQNLIELDFGYLASGVYMAAIVIEGELSYQKVVKR